MSKSVVVGERNLILNYYLYKKFVLLFVWKVCITILLNVCIIICMESLYYYCIKYLYYYLYGKFVLLLY